MANEMVNYNNDMNTVALRKFNSVEMDIFIAICAKMKDKELDIIEFDFDYLKKLVNWTDTNSHSFSKMLDSTYNKLIQCNIRIGNDRIWTRFVLFTKYTINLEKQTVSVGVNTEFRYILNKLTSNFTKFELEEFLSFKSSYTKEFFRRMKQFRSTGIYKVTIEEFRRMLDIPTSYKISEIDKWVLKPILKELKPNYELKMKKIYKAQNRGRPSVIGFEFKFKKSENANTIQDKLNFDLFFYFSTYKDSAISRIEDLKRLSDGKIKITLISRNGKYGEEIVLENENHLKNFINKYKINKKQTTRKKIVEEENFEDNENLTITEEIINILKL